MLKFQNNNTTVIKTFEITPASTDDREWLRDMSEG